MTDSEKRRFDALTALRDHAWREFENKSQAEWRLGFGLWAAILGGAGVIVTTPTLAASATLTYMVALYLLALCTIHIKFMRWVQGKLGDCRDRIYEAQGEMRRMLSLPPAPEVGASRGNRWRHPSLVVQVAISVLAAAVLIFALYSRGF